MRQNMWFVDGENLVLRYQDMLKTGRKPKQGVLHNPDLLVWHPEVTNRVYMDIIRVSYYQTAVGDSNKVEEACEIVGNTPYRFEAQERIQGDGFLRPRIFKKEKKSSKTKSVDINLTVDMLRHATDQHLETLVLMSGDGDYLPLVEEVARRGKQVLVAAFSSGLSKRLRHAADDFMNLDSVFFEPVASSSPQQNKSPAATKA